MVISEPKPKEVVQARQETQEEPVAVVPESDPQKEEVEAVKTVSQLKTEKRRNRKKKEDEPAELK